MAKKKRKKRKPKKVGRPKGATAVKAAQKKLDAPRKAKAKEAKDPKTGKFLPGHSFTGSKRGRISMRAELNRMLQEIGTLPVSRKKKHTRAREILEALYRLARLGDTKAIQLCLEHNSGKPVQASVDVTPSTRRSEMPDDELERLIGKMALQEKLALDKEDEEDDG